MKFGSHQELPPSPKETTKEIPVPLTEHSSVEDAMEMALEYTKEGSAEIQEGIDLEKIVEAAQESVGIQIVQASQAGGKRRVFKTATAALGCLALVSMLSPSSAEAGGFHRRRSSPWKAVGVYAAVEGINAVLGGGTYMRQYPGSYGYGRGSYSDPYRYRSQVEQTGMRSQEQIMREELRQKGMTDREALKRGIIPPEYRVHKTPPRMEVEPPVGGGEQQQISQEKSREVNQLGKAGQAYKAGYEAGTMEVAAAKQYGDDPTPDLTPGRWAELLASHNKEFSPHWLKAFRDAWVKGGGEVK